MAFTLFGKSGLASLLTTGKSGIAAALTVSAGAAVGAGTLIKNDAGEPLISSLLSSPPAVESEAVPESGESSKAPATGQSEPQQLAALPEDGGQAEETVVAEDPPGTPRFDILRVEPDGSVVVAGSAIADSAVEILSGSDVVGKGKAGASGDFAIVFDDPLPPGDHELVIRAVPKEGEPVLSAETGIVSIPEQGDEAGQVLAMVSRDGAASRILQGPGSSQPAEPVAEAAAEPEAPVEEEVAEAPAEEEIEPAVAAAEPSVPVMVQAVDVEKDRLFVAGRGEPGATVRIYLDDEFKGEAKVAPQGAFLIELAQSLEPGRHQLRADMIGRGGKDVASRAQVFVDHEPEEPRQVAEVPVQEPQAAESDISQAETPSTAAAEAAASDGVQETEAITQADTAPETETAVEAEQAEVAQAEAQPVITTGRSVIIRRGDNLWHISRRMLGEGKRYTLIFEANSDQIRNPDLIFPGQVFEVPGNEETAGTGSSSSG